MPSTAASTFGLPRLRRLGRHSLALRSWLCRQSTTINRHVGRTRMMATRENKPGAWQLLEKSLRRLVRFRELRAPADVLEKEIELAKRWWSQVPRLQPGARRIWPEDVLKVAEELG